MIRAKVACSCAVFALSLLTAPTTKANSESMEAATFEAREGATAAARRANAQSGVSQASSAYQAGLDAVNDSDWVEALAKFDRAEKLGAANPDAILYWKAYCLEKLARRAEALQTLSELNRRFPRSKWIQDAKALELQVRQEMGQQVPPESESNDELKLLAINGLMRSDPSQALPLLEKVIDGPGSLRLKGRALFVLAESGSPQARQILARVAQDQSNPALQTKAVSYLGLFGGAAGRKELENLYATSHDVNLKLAILRSFMVSHDSDRLLAAALSDKTPALQCYAVRLLGVLHAQADLWRIYQSSTSSEVSKSVVQALFLSGDEAHLAEVAKSARTPELRVTAIRELGLMRGQKTGPLLLSLYPGARDREMARAVIDALWLHQDAQALVDIARKESDPELKKAVVEKLSLMHSKIATDYLMHILNK